MRIERVRLGVSFVLVLESIGDDSLGPFGAGGVGGREEFDDTGVSSKGRRGTGRRRGDGSVIFERSSKVFERDPRLNFVQRLCV